MCNTKKALSKLNQLKLKSDQETILSYLKNEKIGRSFAKDEVEEVNPNNFAELDPNTSFWYYDGPLDEKTRDFCVEMLAIGKFYTQEDIDYLSFKLGYDVFLYEGAYNCRHSWKRARIKGRIQKGYVPDEVTTNEMDEAADAQDIEVK